MQLEGWALLAVVPGEHSREQPRSSLWGSGSAAKNVIKTIQIDPCNNVPQYIRKNKSHSISQLYFSFIVCSQELLASGKFRILAAQYKSGNFGSSTLNIFSLSSPKIHTINELYKALHQAHCLLNQSVGFRLSNYFYLFIYIF